MNLWKRAFWAALAVTVAMGGCSALQRPSARLQGVRLQRLSLQDAVLEFDVEVINPYSVPLPLAHLDYALATGKGGNEPFFTGRAPLSGEVPAKGSRTLSLPAELDFLRALEALKEIRPGQVVDYQADLGLVVHPPVPGGRVRLPMRTRGELPIPAPPAVRMPTIQWNRSDGGTAGGTARVRVTNTNRFAVRLTEMAYALALASEPVAEARMTENVNIEPGQTATLEIPLQISADRFGRALLRTLGGEQASYTLTGTARAVTPYGPLAWPLGASGQTLLKR